MSLWIGPQSLRSCGLSAGGAGGAKENLRLRELLLPIRRIGGFKRRRRSSSSRGERGSNDLGAAAMLAFTTTSAAVWRRRSQRAPGGVGRILTAAILGNLQSVLTSPT